MVIVRFVVAPPGLGEAGFGLNVAVIHCGAPLTLRLIGELNPPDEAILTVKVLLLFRRRISHRSFSVILNLPASLTFRKIVMLCAALVAFAAAPVIVSGYGPGGVVALVVILSVLSNPFDAGATGFVLNVAVAPAGNPLMARVTGVLNPLIARTATM